MAVAANMLVDGRYRVVQRIGSGGMADVWLAEDTQLGDRRIALKVLHERFAQDREFVERFRREAAAAAGLQHPNVVGVFDRGSLDGTYYIAMEYVEGSSLKDLVGRGMQIAEALEVTRQLLAAARFAHERGIVHRDLKPLNVLVDADGRARVTDFGIARAGPSEITQEGSVMGTAQYLSPEQAQGLQVTAASDLYSIGVILFEMLAGRVPFEAESAVAVAMKQVSEQPLPPSHFNPAVPPALDAVVLRALAKDPMNRFATAEEFLAALDAAEADPAGRGGDTAAYAPIAAPPPEEPRGGGRKALLATLGALILAGALVLGGLQLFGGDQVRVPSVIGERNERAIETLEQAGFEVDIDQRESEQPRNRVVEQDPQAGEEADEGSTVTITVSLGPGAAKIPRVTGLREQQATRRLERAGFEVRTVEGPSQSVAAGRAIGTRPGAGTRLARGQTVTLRISSGPAVTEVPDVVGQSQAAAQQQIRAAGLIPDVDTRDADEPEGTVIEQSPGPGESVDPQSTVTIVVSTGAGSVVVKDVVGQTERSATRTLSRQGLDVTVREQEVSDPSDVGIVLSQSPGGGTRVSSGDSVTITVGRLAEPPAGGPPADEPPPDEPVPTP